MLKLNPKNMSTKWNRQVFSYYLGVILSFTFALFSARVLDLSAASLDIDVSKRNPW